MTTNITLQSIKKTTSSFFWHQRYFYEHLDIWIIPLNWCKSEHKRLVHSLKSILCLGSLLHRVGVSHNKCFKVFVMSLYYFQEPGANGTESIYVTKQTCVIITRIQLNIFQHKLILFMCCIQLGRENLNSISKSHQPSKCVFYIWPQDTNLLHGTLLKSLKRYIPKGCFSRL